MIHLDGNHRRVVDTDTVDVTLITDEPHDEI